MAGSDKVRDHLANERTFLAWVRTALGLIGLGFVLARMGLFLNEMAGGGPASGRPSPPHLGNEFVLSGIVVLALGTVLSGWSGWLYHRNRRAIDDGTFVPAGVIVTGLAAVVLVGGLAIVALAVWRLSLVWSGW